LESVKPLATSGQVPAIAAHFLDQGSF
jgi:hypothetical protein